VSDVAIRVEHLSKQYRIGKKQERYYTLRDTIADAFTAPLRWVRSRRNGGSPNGGEEDTIWALKDVSFEVKHGEVVGIIGRNGAGKSTLLKILSRITEPTEGRVEIHGRVASLLEVGTGFHPELTGRENIYLNGAILGMSKAEIDRKFDEIVEFAEIEKFIDTPVKRYSSGMYVRLAFAVAAHLEPEILLVDEVLAVGDAAFQKKCLGKMGDVAKAGRTVLFVSHNMAAVEGLCERAVLLDQGRVELSGDPATVIAAYLSRSGEEYVDDLLSRSPRRGDGRMRIVDWCVFDAMYGEGNVVGCGNPCEFRLRYTSNPGGGDLPKVSVALVVKDALDRPLLSGATHVVNADFDRLPSSGSLRCCFDTFPLVPGVYYLYIWCSVNGEIADRIENAGSFRVAERDFFGTGRMPQATKHGFILLKHRWIRE
jgi:lipopolysaccharide transport system ATP-binding protein